jgi:hypothetical protein
MDTPPSAALLQAVHAAYESHNPEEARRLLHTQASLSDCHAILRCGDEAYLNWLLSHDLLPTGQSTTSWPEMQERQLQCDALAEPERPRCILTGEWEGDTTTREN